METIYLAGGCFWCTEAVFRSLKGVLIVTPGYMGGHIDNPTYHDVIKGDTGHAETVKVEYDSKIISTENILRVFLGSHDPTTLDRQGSDVGSQYRSAIFYTEHEQKDIAQSLIVELNKKLPEGKKIVTEVGLAPEFFTAEDYHHGFYAENPEKMYCQLVITPKVKKVAENYEGLIHKK